MTNLAGYGSRCVLSRRAGANAFNMLALAALSFATPALAADLPGYGYGWERVGEPVVTYEPRYNEYAIGPQPGYRRVIEYREVISDPPVQTYPQATYGAAYPQVGYGAAPYPQVAYPQVAYPQAYPQVTYGAAYPPVTYGQPAYGQVVNPAPVVETTRTYVRPVVRERIVTQYTDVPSEPFGPIDRYPPLTFTDVVDVDPYVAPRPYVQRVYRNDAGVYGRYGVYEGRAVAPAARVYRRW